MVAMGVEYVEKDKQQAFLAYMDKGFQKFGIPLSVDGETVIYCEKRLPVSMKGNNEEPIRWFTEGEKVLGMIDKTDEGFKLHFASKEYGPYPQLAMAKAKYGQINKIKNVYWSPAAYRQIA